MLRNLAEAVEHGGLDVDSRVGTESLQQVTVEANFPFDGVEILMVEAFHHPLDAGLAVLKKAVVFILLAGLEEGDLID